MYPSVESEVPESWLNWLFKLLLLQLYLFHFFHLGVNLDSFIPEADCSFLSIYKYDLYIGIRILIGQKWQKWFQFRHISNFQLVLLENYSFEFLYQVLNWHFHTTAGLLHWRICGFIFLIGLNSSITISIGNFFLENGFFKINCCKLNLSILRPLNGKYRCATAPLVSEWLEVVKLKGHLKDAEIMYKWNGLEWINVIFHNHGSLNFVVRLAIGAPNK